MFLFVFKVWIPLLPHMFFAGISHIAWCHLVVCHVRLDWVILVTWTDMQYFVPRRHKLELLQSRSEQARCISVTPLRVCTQQLLAQFKASIMFIITVEVIFGTTQSIFKRNAVREHISNFDDAQGKPGGGHDLKWMTFYVVYFLQTVLIQNPWTIGGSTRGRKHQPT